MGHRKWSDLVRLWFEQLTLVTLWRWRWARETVRAHTTYFLGWVGIDTYLLPAVPRSFTETAKWTLLDYLGTAMGISSSFQPYWNMYEFGEDGRVVLKEEWKWQRWPLSELSYIGSNEVVEYSQNPVLQRCGFSQHLLFVLQTHLGMRTREQIVWRLRNQTLFSGTPRALCLISEQSRRQWFARLKFSSCFSDLHARSIEVAFLIYTYET